MTKIGVLSGTAVSMRVDLIAEMILVGWTLVSGTLYRSGIQIGGKYVFIDITYTDIHVYDDDGTGNKNATQIGPSDNSTSLLMNTGADYDYRIDEGSILLIQKNSTVGYGGLFGILYNTRGSFFSGLINCYIRTDSSSKDCYYKEGSSDKAGFIHASNNDYNSLTNDRRVLMDFGFYHYNDFQINFNSDILSSYDLRNENGLVFSTNQFVIIENVQYLAYKISSGLYFLLFKWE